MHLVGFYLLFVGVTLQSVRTGLWSKNLLHNLGEKMGA